jgi:RNA polymerase sigma-70 factor (ECF subfamily)
MPPRPAAPAEEFRSYLTCLGRSRIRPALAEHVDLSGVVQDTFLDAHAAGSAFPATARARRVWLARSFLRNLVDTVRHLTAARRDVRRTVPLAARPAVTPSEFADLLPAPASTPSTRAARAEEAGRLARALAALRPDQRRAIEWRYLHGKSVSQIADGLGKSKEAVAGLLKRGLEDLRGLLPDGR